MFCNSYLLNRKIVYILKKIEERHALQYIYDKICMASFLEKPSEVLRSQDCLVSIDNQKSIYV